jgi:putative ABC transport system permease protein
VFRIHAVLVSLIAAYAYYSLALVLLGSPNVYFGDRIQPSSPFVAGAFAAFIFGGAVAALGVLARTRWGLKVIASGSNPELAQRHRLNPVWWQGVGLGFAFSFVTVAGALFAWRVGYVDVGSGSGLLLIGIFVVLVARAAQSRIRLGLNGVLLYVALLGYLGIFQMAITLGMRPQWLRGLTAITLLVFLLMLPRKKGKLIAI